VNLSVFVQNHKARNPDRIVTAIRANGIEAKVHTDRSDHYLKRGHERARGNWDNYRGILAAAESASTPWSIVFQDDVSVPPGVLAKMAHVLDFMPGPMVAFYVPQNALFSMAVERDCHVVETYANFWIQAMAFQTARLTDLCRWADAHIQPAWDQRGDGCGDDDLLNLYCSVNRIPCRVVLPSLVQHIGAHVSLFGTNGKIGKYDRVSACYQPHFDVTSVDWPNAIGSALVDRKRISRSDVRMQRAYGL
jgi:hypothetical protein